jgi:antitoxin CptB
MPDAAQRQREFAWHCRRGMLELDILLNDFVAQHFHEMNDKECVIFEKLLSYADQELLEMLMGRQPAREQGEQHVIDKILQTHST